MPKKRCKRTRLKLPPGKPSKYNRETRAVILKMLMLGFSYQRAAEHAGIGLSTLSEWRKKYPEFDLDCKRARDHRPVQAAESLGALIQANHFGAVRFALTTLTEEYKEQQNIVIQEQDYNPDERFL